MDGTLNATLKALGSSDLYYLAFSSGNLLLTKSPLVFIHGYPKEP